MGQWKLFANNRFEWSLKGLWQVNIYRTDWKLQLQLEDWLSRDTWGEANRRNGPGIRRLGSCPLPFPTGLKFFMPQLPVYQMGIITQLLGCLEMRLNEMANVKCLAQRGTATCNAQHLLLLLSFTSVQSFYGEEILVLLIVCQLHNNLGRHLWLIFSFGRWRNRLRKVGAAQWIDLQTHKPVETCS